MVDSAQYKRREDGHDYDIIVDNFPQSESPGNEQRDFWGSAAADKDGSPQHRRHQEPRDRQADRQDRVLDGPRRSRRRNHGARSRAAVELLRGAAVALSFRALGLLGYLRAPADASVANRGAHASLVDRSREAEGARRPHAANDGQRHRRSAEPRPGQPACSRSCWRRPCSVPPALAEFRHGLSAFGDLKYPADFKHFDYVNPDAPKGGRLSTIGTERAHDLRQLQRLHPEGRRGAGARVPVRHPDDARRRRARCGLWPRRQRGRDRARPHVGHLPAAARGKVRRRLAAHGRRRRLHASTP